MNAVVPMQHANSMVTAEQAAAVRNALKNSLYPGATDDSVEMVLAYCRAAQLDPMTKPVHIVPMSVKKPGSRDQYEWRDVVMPGIELYRTKAHRTGEYAGQDEAEFGPTVEQFGIRFPEWCRATVYRIVCGQRVPYSAKAYWLESYATVKRDSDAPNAMWRKRPFGQLEKCAEALALRKAFPEAVGAQPTAEEMEGKTLDMDAPAAPALQMPRALAKPADRSVIEGESTEFHGEPEATPEAPAGEAGIHGLTDGQRRIVLAKAAAAGWNEAELLEHYPSINPGNLNTVLADLRVKAEQA